VAYLLNKQPIDNGYFNQATIKQPRRFEPEATVLKCKATHVAYGVLDPEATTITSLNLTGQSNSVKHIA
jgi:hypothetical protein